MTTIEYVVLFTVAILAVWFVDMVANYLNLRTLVHVVPKRLRDLFTDEEICTVKQYTKARTTLHMVESTASLLVLFAFWFGGGFEFLDLFVRSFGLGSILTGLLFVGILIVLNYVVCSLPFGLYNTFVIEEKYGFNRMTLLTFVCDSLTMFLLFSLFGGFLLGTLFWLFQNISGWAWLVSLVFMELFLLLISYIWPTFISPMFQKWSPIPNGELKTKILELANRLDFPLTGIYVIDGSRRSTKANAFFTGIGNNKRIALYDTLIDMCTVDELVAILGHEIGHNKLRHTQYYECISFLHLGVLVYLLSIFLESTEVFEAFYITQPSVYMGFILFSITISPLEKLYSVLVNYLARLAEYQADNFSKDATGGYKHLVSSLKTLNRKSLVHQTPHPLLVAMDFSHPTLFQRIERLEKTD